MGGRRLGIGQTRDAMLPRWDLASQPQHDSQLRSSSSDNRTGLPRLSANALSSRAPSEDEHPSVRSTASDRRISSLSPSSHWMFWQTPNSVGERYGPARYTTFMGIPSLGVDRFSNGTRGYVRSLTKTARAPSEPSRVGRIRNALRFSRPPGSRTPPRPRFRPRERARNSLSTRRSKPWPQQRWMLAVVWHPEATLDNPPRRVAISGPAWLGRVVHVHGGMVLRENPPQDATSGQRKKGAPGRALFVIAKHDTRGGRAWSVKYPPRGDTHSIPWRGRTPRGGLPVDSSLRRCAARVRPIR